MIDGGSFFISGILRLNFAFQNAGQQLRSSVILKIPQLGVLEDHGRKMGFYDKERYIYNGVIPLMFGSWSGEKVVPEFYVSTESGILILENL